MRTLASELQVLHRKPRRITEAKESTRWLLMARHLYEGGAITREWLSDHYGVSRATAKRDMARIEETLPTVSEQRWRESRVIRLRRA